MGVEACRAYGLGCGSFVASPLDAEDLKESMSLSSAFALPIAQNRASSFEHRLYVCLGASLVG